MRTSYIKESALIKIKHLYKIRNLKFMKHYSFCAWWNCRGLIYHEFVKSNLKITAYTCVQQLQRVKKKLIEKHPILTNSKNVILSYDNAKPLTAKST